MNSNTDIVIYSDDIKEMIDYDIILSKKSYLYMDFILFKC